MADETLTGTVLASAIVPSSPLDEYPTHHAKLGKGGYRSVKTIEERDAIPMLRREEGMKVYVIANKIEYSLLGGLENTNWDATGSSSGNIGPSFEMVSPDGKVYIVGIDNNGRLTTVNKI